MNHTVRRFFVCCMPAVCLATFGSMAHAQWTPPTPEELSMTSQAEVPGAPAVYLFREETTEDSLHMWSKYARIKILTDGGKEYANVELQQYQSSDNGGYTINGIQGRTIHPDGTIIPFTGKPFEKLLQKGNGYKEMAKVFTLPNVEVGSIIEYRYQLRYDDDRVIAPDWFVQSELYTRKAHYMWKPTGRDLVTKTEKGEQVTSAIAWSPILPKEAVIIQKRLPSDQLMLELDVHDIPPRPNEEYMPPIKSFSYRVLFYYTPYRSIDDYWKNEGKGWAKTQDKFIGSGSKVRAAVKDLTADADTQDRKLRKLYAAVMGLDNTAFNRSRSAAEDKSEGLNPPKNADDIWERKRGSDDQMAQLFVAMARAAGMKAYVMQVASRDRTLFLPSYASFSQLQDTIAIVNVDGKEQFFDPGQRYCPYGHLAWKHTMVGGVRQTDGGSALGNTPPESYKQARTERIADLTLDEHGEAAGKVKLTFTGPPALSLRQAKLRGDDTSLNRELRVAVEEMMPKDTEVKVTSIEHLDDYEQPLTINYTVKGQFASSTGKRLIVPSDIFEFNSKPSFPHEKRDIAVYFEYPQIVKDAVRIAFPKSLAIESQPAVVEISLQMSALYSVSSKATPNSLTSYRNFTRSEFVYPPADYPDLRAFYNKLQRKDQEPIVLKAAAQAEAGN